MPTVPTTFVPQVNPAVAGDIGMVQAPQIAVTENMAAQQQVRFGQALTQAGNVMFRTGSAMQDAILQEKARAELLAQRTAEQQRIEQERALAKEQARQDALDEGRAKEAELRAFTQTEQILRGKDGYLRSQGFDADSRYTPTFEALTQSRKEIEDSLENDTQKALFRTSVARDAVRIETMMLDHRDKQVKSAATSQAVARMDQFVQKAIEARGDMDNPIGDFQLYRGIAVNEAKIAGRLNGYAEDSPQTQAAIKEVESNLTVGVVNRMMVDNKFDDANTYLRQQIKDGNVLEQAAQPLLASVNSNRERWMIGQYASTIKTFGRVGFMNDPDNVAVEQPVSRREALTIASEIKDDDIRKGVEASLRTQFDQDEQLERQEYGLLIDRMEQFLAAPGNTVANVPPSAWGRLKPQDQAKFLKAQRQTDELNVMEEIARNPGVLTREYLEDNRGRMTRDTYIKLLGDVNAPGKVIAATVDADQLEATLFANNMMKMADPKSDEDKQASLMFRNSVKTMIDAEQERQKRPLSREEKQRVIDGAIIQYGEQAYVERSWWWDKQMSLGAMTPEQRQAAYIMVGDTQVKLMDMPQTWITGTALPAFQKAGVKNPTMTQLAEYWIKKGRPSR